MNKEEVKESQIYGSFYLDSNEFALAASFIQEVVNAPNQYTSLPLAPPFLKGLFNLRGTVIPVVDLRELLRLKKNDSSENQKVAIIELNNSCIGLLFDRTGEIFRSNADERSDFDNSSDGSVIRGVFKKEEGKRIVQILDVNKLFTLQNVPKDHNQNRLNRDIRGNKRGKRRQCISFRVGPAICSLPISDIQEILKVNQLSESIFGGTHCIGTIDVRGTIVPIIDFPALFEYREVDRSAIATQGDRRIIVMRLDQELFGLMVDSVDSIISYFSDELITFPLVQQSRADMFVGCISRPGELDILLLDHQKILNNNEIQEITRGHSDLFKTSSQSKNDKISQGESRKTYITFSIDNSYAVAITDVKEIIDYPKQLLHPPGLQKHIQGLLNLRGDLVTIVDARTLYSEPATTGDSKTQKVLVFKQSGLHFGLIVDSVEEIVTLSNKDKVKLPELLYRSDGNMSADLSEAIEVVDSKGQRRSLLILNVEAIALRIQRRNTI